jgi:hypothetical protein
MTVAQVWSMKMLFLALLLAATPALAQESILVLADDGGLAPAEVHAIRGVTAAALRQHEVALSQDRATEGVHPIDDSLAALAFSLGARRIFVLRIAGRLGAKIPLTLEELQARTLETVYSASLTAASIEECDVVAGRLAAAVVERRSAEDTEQMRTVTAQESRPFAKKPGERFFFLGLPIALYNARSSGSPAGFSFGYGYEAEFFRIEASAGGFSRGSDGIAYLTFSGAFIPFSGEWSPYFGGGLGYQWAGNQGGMGGTLEAGLEAFRLHGVRGLLGVQALIPFFDANNGGTTQNHSVYPAGFIRLGF